MHYVFGSAQMVLENVLKLMIPSAQNMLLGFNKDLREALKLRLASLEIRQNTSSKTLLQIQKEESKKEEVFIRTQNILQQLYEVIEHKTKIEKVLEKAAQILEKDYNSYINSTEFFRFILQNAKDPEKYQIHI